MVALNQSTNDYDHWQQSLTNDQEEFQSFRDVGRGNLQFHSSSGESLLRQRQQLGAIFVRLAQSVEEQLRHFSIDPQTDYGRRLGALASHLYAANVAAHELWQISLRELDINNIGAWPRNAKIGFCVMIAVLIIGLAWWLFVRDKRTELEGRSLRYTTRGYAADRPEAERYQG